MTQKPLLNMTCRAVCAEEDWHIKRERISEPPVFLESELSLSIEERIAIEEGQRPQLSAGSVNYLWLCNFVNNFLFWFLVTLKTCMWRFRVRRFCVRVWCFMGFTHALWSSWTPLPRLVPVSGLACIVLAHTGVVKATSLVTIMWRRSPWFWWLTLLDGKDSCSTVWWQF